jgi:hypothetical protein
LTRAATASDEVLPSASAALSASRTLTRSRTALPPPPPYVPLVTPELMAAAGGSAAVTAAVGGAVSSPAAALQVTRALTLMSIADCRRDHTAKLPFPFSIVPSFGFGAAAGHYTRGAIVANLLVCVAVLPLALLVGALRVKLKWRNPPSHMEGLSFLQCAWRCARAPGVLIIPVTIALGGWCFAGVALLAHGAGAGDAALAGLAAALLIALGGASYAAVAHATDAAGGLFFQECELLRNTFQENRSLRVFPNRHTHLAAFARLCMFGTEAWVFEIVTVDATKSPMLQQFGMLFAKYRGPADDPVARSAGARLVPYYLLWEIFATAALTGVAGLIPFACTAVAVVVAVLNLAVFVVHLVLRPYTVPAKNALAHATNGLTLLASLLIAVAVVAGETGIARAGVDVAVASTYVSMASTALSVAKQVFRRVVKCKMRLPGRAGRKGVNLVTGHADPRADPLLLLPNDSVAARAADDVVSVESLEVSVEMDEVQPIARAAPRQATAPGATGAGRGEPAVPGVAPRQIDMPVFNPRGCPVFPAVPLPRRYFGSEREAMLHGHINCAPGDEHFEEVCEASHQAQRSDADKRCAARLAASGVEL